MKVLMVADARSIHTRRWAVALKARGVDIVLFSLYPSPDDFLHCRESIYTSSIFLPISQARGSEQLSEL